MSPHLAGATDLDVCRVKWEVPLALEASKEDRGGEFRPSLALRVIEWGFRDVDEYSAIALHVPGYLFGVHPEADGVKPSVSERQLRSEPDGERRLRGQGVVAMKRDE